MKKQDNNNDFEIRLMAVRSYLDEVDNQIQQEYKNDPLGLLEQVALKTISTHAVACRAFDDLRWGTDTLIKIYELKQKRQNCDN